MNDATRAQTLQAPAPDGTPIEAYYAAPERQEQHGAVHAFFSVDSQKYRTAAALAGWQRILAWFTRYLGTGRADSGTP